MRKILGAVVVAIVLVFGVRAADAAGATYEVQVAGLACPFCAYGIEKSLSGLDGVESVETHIEDGIVVVDMAEGKTLDKAEVGQAVKDAGFTLEGFEERGGEQ